MLSDTVEYALRAVAFLTSQMPEAQTTPQIAAATKVPESYLSKVLQALVRAGIVHSKRGVGGGMTLAKNPETLSILEVVNAVDPIKRITSCPLELKSHGVRLCPLHKRLDQAYEMVEQAFAKTTLSEILNEPSESTPLCELKKKS